MKEQLLVILRWLHVVMYVAVYNPMIPDTLLALKYGCRALEFSMNYYRVVILQSECVLYSKWRLVLIEYDMKWLLAKPHSSEVETGNSYSTLIWFYQTINTLLLIAISTLLNIKYCSLYCISVQLLYIVCLL